MFYKRKFYIINNDFVDIFNRHFIETNLPNQLKNGARLVGRWMDPLRRKQQKYLLSGNTIVLKVIKKLKRTLEVTKNIIKKFNDWYERHGGRDHVFKEYIYEFKNEELISTLSDEKGKYRTIIYTLRAIRPSVQHVGRSDL